MKLKRRPFAPLQKPVEPIIDKQRLLAQKALGNGALRGREIGIARRAAARLQKLLPGERILSSWQDSSDRKVQVDVDGWNRGRPVRTARPLVKQHGDARGSEFG
jgi:hypothetical protein